MSVVVGGGVGSSAAIGCLLLLHKPIQVSGCLLPFISPCMMTVTQGWVSSSAAGCVLPLPKKPTQVKSVDANKGRDGFPYQPLVVHFPFVKPRAGQEC